MEGGTTAAVIDLGVNGCFADTGKKEAHLCCQDLNAFACVLAGLAGREQAKRSPSSPVHTGFALLSSKFLSAFEFQPSSKEEHGGEG